MSVDLNIARSFMAKHARVLDRRRFELLTGESDSSAILAAVDGYRNEDGGYGWGLEPDLRASESQPGCALHALEAFAEVAPVTTKRAVELCDWLAAIALPDGGFPFAIGISDDAGCAPFWVQADPTMSTLQSTAFIASTALRVAAHDSAVAAHPSLERAARYCLDAIAEIESAPHAYVLSFAVSFLNAAYDSYPEAPTLLDRLGEFVPDNGIVPVEGGLDGEAMRPLDFAPLPHQPARKLFAQGIIESELDNLANQQQDDGGWTVDFASYSPAATLEWRGYATVKAVSILRGNGRI